MSKFIEFEAPQTFDKQANAIVYVRAEQIQHVEDYIGNWSIYDRERWLAKIKKVVDERPIVGSLVQGLTRTWISTESPQEIMEKLERV